MTMKNERVVVVSIDPGPPIQGSQSLRVRLCYVHDCLCAQHTIRAYVSEPMRRSGAVSLVIVMCNSIRHWLSLAVILC